MDNVYITRDNGDWVDIWVGSEPPEYERVWPDEWDCPAIHRMCRKVCSPFNTRLFKRAFGFVPRKKSCKKYTITVEEISD